MILASLVISVIYLFLIGSLAYGFDRIKVFHLENKPSKTKFSVIIPFRNEAKNLPELLQSIKGLIYNNELFEVVFVNDASEDNSVEIIKNQLLKSGIDFLIVSNRRTTNSPKKDAINTAIKQAKYDWIISTDADCTLPINWLNCFDECIQKTDAFCVAGPVKYSENFSFLNQFQVLDLLSLQGATIGGFGLKTPFLCNGANFGYRKEIFENLNGFTGNTNIASGDDIFFLEKVVKTYPDKLHYLKSNQVTVSTKTQPNWNLLLQQRIRWAAKTSAYNNAFGKFTGLTVLLMNALVVVDLALSIFGLFNFKIWFYLVIVKLAADFVLIYKSALFFNQKSVIRRFIFAFLLYPFFSVLVAITSLGSGYQWKGRAFKK